MTDVQSSLTPAAAPAVALSSTPRSKARQQREQQLLELAQQVLRQDGFTGLTMDRLQHRRALGLVAGIGLPISVLVGLFLIAVMVMRSERLQSIFKLFPRKDK